MKTRRCFLCRSKSATLASQLFFTNHGVPVTAETVQVRAKPSICEDCAKDRFDGAALVVIVDDYQQCRLKIAKIAADETLRRKALVLYRSKKYQPKKVENG